MSTERIRQLGIWHGYCLAANALCEEAALMEVAEQGSQMAENICKEMASRLRKRADEMQTKSIEAMQGGAA